MRRYVATAALALTACSSSYVEPATAVDYCEVPNVEALLGCSPDNLEAHQVAQCQERARQMSIRQLAGIPEVCRSAGAPRRMPID